MYQKPIISSLGLENSIVLRKTNKTAKPEDNVYAYESTTAMMAVILYTIDPSADITIFIVVA